MSLVSIYIPTKNRVQLLKRAVNSVIEQTYTNWELIIVNDGSTDETENYLNSLAQSDKRIKVIHHAESKGACASRNEAIFSATGEFITGLDDDDYFYKDRLQRFIENWDEKYVALSTSNDIEVNGSIIRKGIKKELIIKQEDLLFSNYLGNQVFTKTNFLKEVNGFDPDYKMWQDADCWYRLLKKGKAKRLIYSTYVFEESEREDRITNLSLDKLMETYNLFVRKHSLSLKQSALLKNYFIYYGTENYSVSFIWNMFEKSGFNIKIGIALFKGYLRNIFIK